MTLLDKLTSLYGSDNLIIRNRAIKVLVPETDRASRRAHTFDLAATINGTVVSSGATGAVKCEGFTIRVKPRSRQACKRTTPIDYGLLPQFMHFAPSWTLPERLKEQSDEFLVSRVNRALVPVLEKHPRPHDGVVVCIANTYTANVVGCIPVMSTSEPKADAVLVRRVDNALVPTCYLSYKSGVEPDNSNQYSGLSVKSLGRFAQHPEVLQFFHDIEHQHVLQAEPWRPCIDPTLQFVAAFGMDYMGPRGINNCDFIVQGTVTLQFDVNGVYRLAFERVHASGRPFEKAYAPVFGARTSLGRRTRTPTGGHILDLRLGIFAREYRRKWTDDTQLPYTAAPHYDLSFYDSSSLSV
jgi:hypothetical protein